MNNNDSETTTRTDNRATNNCLLAPRVQQKTMPEQQNNYNNFKMNYRRPNDTRRQAGFAQSNAIWTNCDQQQPINCDTNPRFCKQSAISLAALIVLISCCALPYTTLVAASSSVVDLNNDSNSSMPIIIDHLNQANDQQQQQQTYSLPNHLQPASLFLAQNKSINFTHLVYDESSQSIYVGATNWLFQLGASDLRLDYALKTGPVSESSRDCSPADCSSAQLASINDLDSIPTLQLHQANDLRESSLVTAKWQQQRTRPGHHQQHNHHHPAHTTMHMLAAGQTNSSSGGYAHLTAQRRAGPLQQVTPASAQSSGATSTLQQQMQNNNYHKILNIDHDSRQLIVCGSLNQGACRRHQLGKLTNFSELIPLPVASNDEHSSSVSLVVSGGGGGNSGQLNNQFAAANKQKSILYVAATNSRLGPYREMVPAISARYLDPPSRAMQIIERSFTDSARIDISFELRDYYLVNYVYAFQHQNFIYFATVQRRSPLRQLEEWGYQTRLARLCLNDLSFQSYTEMTLECSQPKQSSSSGSSSNKQDSAAQVINYNLLQDAHLIQSASSTVQQALGLRPTSGGGAVLVGTFAQSRDHTTKSSQQSAICLFPMDRIEQKFNENINSCYNGTTKARNMNYIAGSVNDCPKGGKTQMPTNYCNEPIKLNGSISLIGSPVIAYRNELLTSISATLAPTNPINGQLLSSLVAPPTTMNRNTQQQQQQQLFSRHHQVLLAGTSDGQLKRIVLVNQQQHLVGVEFDSIQLDESKQNAIIADMPMIPHSNPQLSPLTAGQLQQQQQSTINHHQQSTLGENSAAAHSNPQLQQRQQFVLAATAHKIVKLPINVCKFKSSSKNNYNSTSSTHNQNNQQLVDECQMCSQLQDPFCGWCSTTGSCSSRDECLIAAAAQNQKSSSSAAPVQFVDKTIHWTPFDSIKCSHYQPISPQFVPIEADQQQIVDVNVRLPQDYSHLLSSQGGKSGGASIQLAAQLAETQFVCHFDYMAVMSNNRSAATSGQPRPSGATTKATQARLNLHAGTMALGCPLPAHAQRPTGALDGQDQLRVRLSVRLAATSSASASSHNQQRQLIEQLLAGANQQQHTSKQLLTSQQQPINQIVDQAAAPPSSSAPATIERELTFYECSAHHSCRSCLSSGSQQRKWSCSWCPMSQRCTFNASHLDFGCAASAVVATTPQSAAQYASPQQSNQIRGSHLTASLDRAQASVLGASIDRLSQCPPVGADELPPYESINQLSSSAESDGELGGEQVATTLPTSAAATATTATLANTHGGASATATKSVAASQEILIPNNARRSIQVALTKPILALSQQQKRVLKLECLIELEGAKARFSARLLDQQSVLCQETQFAYQVELATQRAQLNVILNDNQVIETIEVTFYKCHLFGVSPPALASSLGAPPGAAGQQQSSAAWKAQELFGGSWAAPPPATRAHHHHSAHHQLNNMLSSNSVAQQRQSDCSMCANVARKYQCSWCSNTCQHSEQCTELPASTCPPPRIDSIHPNSGPLEGGTLLTIEGSNLGSNEREIQDKITVGGEPCQLVMYSVSTRIVCKTGPSLLGQQSATVFVGNRAGVTSAYEKFHYKAVHLTDVNPRIGPVSGGTRLFLSGTNLNIGSRVKIFLDDNPCSIDGNYELSGSNQISCMTAPNLFANSMRITRLTLMIDNSTHYLPYPFTYQPDPIITNIEPAESFLSGGRLILIAGHHLASPQSTKLMVYHEHKHNILNGTNCLTQNDTLITCLTPAISRELLASLMPPATTTNNNRQQQDQQDQQTGLNESSNMILDQQQQQLKSSLNYESGGLRLKMMLIMDDVKSVRNLDEYYHHLPHYLTYYDDPELFRLPQPVVDFSDELVIQGDNLQLKQLDQDMLITIGAHICPLKAIQSQQVVCEPPQKIAPVYDDSGRTLLERPVLPIVALIGANLRFSIGLMQYSSRQYQFSATGNSAAPPAQQVNGNNRQFVVENLLAFLDPTGGHNYHQQQQQQQQQPLATTSPTTNGQQQTSYLYSPSVLMLILLSSIGFVVAFSVTFMFALARFRQSKAEREYKRIQLQMGSLDMAPNAAAGHFAANGLLFNKIDLPGGNNIAQQHQLPSFVNHHHQSNVQQSMRSKAMGYVGGAFSTKKLFNQFQQPIFPPSLLTDISSLIGSSPTASNNKNVQHQQQHLVRLGSDGQTIINSTTTASSGGATRNFNNQQPIYHGISSNTASSSSSQSSPNSSARNSSPGHQQLFSRQQQQQMNGQFNSNLLSVGGNGQQQTLSNSSNSRNFNWTQEAPSTIVPYAVIEACNLTLEGKNAIKEYV